MSQLELTSELELTVNRTIAAPREKVFNAWLSPQTLARFMRPCEGEGMDARVENDPVEGGRFSIVMKLPDREVPHAGTYLEIDPHSRLAFTWGSPHSLDDSVVTIDFTAIDSRTTEIVLRQVKFASEQARDGHVAGWTEILGKLAAIVA
ncbi:SRPBCC domain-containing protein [Rhizobium sp. ARZ01]|uniref:SRPBCC family protein n=1 Tax=Rhizobium sp. ARZ01 TaxID=2769313 RepID=UPI00177C0535|nr:SRPBCC domain-containing protein [Rhizobium sp. ARZ01]MBD9374262.1 SRPBCC domain-containing protein [Rhizobium sp. ARZ01]